MLCLILASCGSKSGRRSIERTTEVTFQIPTDPSIVEEKVVMLTVKRETFFATSPNLYTYKIKRIANNTVTFIQIKSSEPYLPKDTIMWRFNK